jgi:NADH dehydrogenase
MSLKISPAVKPLVCLLGGTGFVGSHLAALFSAHGYRVRIPTRRGVRHAALRVLPGVELLEADVHDTTALRAVLQGCAAAVNLVAILNENRAGDFQPVHVRLPRNLARLCREGGVSRLLHMSALNADAARGPSRYLRSKGEGEELAHQAEGVQVTSFRPSVIFGPDDHFFNRFAGLLKLSPGLFPLACPQARFAPVFVGDVAQAILAALEDPRTIGQRYDLCGPRAYTLKELVEYTARVLELKRRVIGLGRGLSRLQAAVMGHLPGKAFTHDNYLSLQVDAVCTGGFPALFGIEPAPVEALVPLYLRHRDQRGRLDEYRQRARHTY